MAVQSPARPTRPHRTLNPRRGTAPRSPGHRFTRWPAALVGPSTLAAVAMDDGRDPHAVRKAIDGADAVISTPSAERRKGPNHAAEVSR
jgi:hypothetical protein